MGGALLERRAQVTRDTAGLWSRPAERLLLPWMQASSASASTASHRREQDYLRAMAELGPGPHRSGEIAAKLGIAVTSAGPLRTGLIRKGMIWSPSHGHTAFTVPMFDQYMFRAMPDWPPAGE